MSLCGGMIIVQGFSFSLRLHGNRGQCWCSHTLTTCSEQQRGTAHMGKGQNITTLHLSWPDLIVRNEETLKNAFKKYNSSFTFRVWQHWWKPDLDQVPALGCQWQPVCHLVVWFGALAPRGHPQCCCQTHISLRRVWSHHLTPLTLGIIRKSFLLCSSTWNSNTLFHAFNKLSHQKVSLMLD